MTTPAVRSAAERIADTIRRLGHDDNVWLSTASADGVAHLVPLSLAWIDGEMVLATPASTPTARNAATTGRGRAALDDAEDVVTIAGTVDVEPVADADPELLDRFH
ncbi:MAG: pyridoxamine 5'-phosphate oxidase family protein, partial [Acidimicrobiales bacterium]